MIAIKAPHGTTVEVPELDEVIGYVVNQLQYIMCLSMHVPHHKLIMTDANGFFETSLPYGDYNVTIHHQASNSFFDQNIELALNDRKPFILIQFRA